MAQKMAQVDWYYHRNGCRTCQRADEYLQQCKIKVKEQLDARKNRITPAAAVRLARTADKVWVTRGKSFVYFDMKKNPPSDAELKKLLIGPSGNLRAPTIRQGKKLFVGFDPDAYDEGLKSGR